MLCVSDLILFSLLKDVSQFYIIFVSIQSQGER